MPKSAKKSAPARGKSWDEALADGSLRKVLRGTTDRPLLEHFFLNAEEQYVVFAALCTMVEDVHAPQDTMTEEQWGIAENVYRRLTKIVDERFRARGTVGDEPHYEIIGKYVKEAMGCCSEAGIPDVQAEEPGATFRRVKKFECSVCGKDRG